MDPAVGQANIVNDVLNLARRNLRSNRLLDLIAKVGRFFDTHSGGSAHMKFETAGVNAGEEVAAQPGNQNYQRSETAGKERNHKDTPMIETNFHQSTIALPKSSTALLKTIHNPSPAT